MASAHRHPNGQGWKSQLKGGKAAVRAVHDSTISPSRGIGALPEQYCKSCLQIIQYTNFPNKRSRDSVRKQQRTVDIIAEACLFLPT